MVGIIFNYLPKRIDIKISSKDKKGRHLCRPYDFFKLT